MAAGGLGAGLKLAQTALSAATSSGSNSSSGGISPQQAAMAEYTAGQDALASNTAFGGTNTGMSTMSTYEGAGANFGQALAEAGLSDQNAAQQNAINQAQNTSNLGNLGTLASNAGFSSGAGFGNTPNTTG